jgi:hypothetical protein
VKKSAAAIVSQWAARNVFQDVFVPRSGAGAMPWSLQDRLDRVARDLVAEAPQSAANTCVTPGRVLVRHADHERGDVWLGARPTGASPVRAVVFCGDERPVPPQDGVGCDDAGDVREPTPPEHLAFHGEAASLVVGET